MTVASHRLATGAALVVVGLLAGCTAQPGDSGATAAAPAVGGPSASTPRPPLPSASRGTSLPPSPPVQLTPVSSSPEDLGRIDVRDGSPLRQHVAVRLPAGTGYSVTAGCVGRPGTLLHWSVTGTTAADPGFLFGSTTPCNGAFVTDAALANIHEVTKARLEVALDAGIDAATVVLRPAPTDSHL